AEHELLTKFLAAVRRNQDEKVYDNHKIETKGQVATVMGNYHFTCATYRAKSKVENHFQCHRCDDGKVRIFLQTQSNIVYIVEYHGCDDGNVRIFLHFRSAQFVLTQRESEKSQQENLKAEHEPRTKLMDEARGDTLKDDVANIAGSEQYHERQYDEPFADIMRHYDEPFAETMRYRVDKYHGRHYDKPYVDIMRYGVELSRRRHHDDPLADIMRYGAEQYHRRHYGLGVGRAGTARLCSFIPCDLT
ncbi:unnamed protein product, partial [Prorocentrum cordatum]